MTKVEMTGHGAAPPRPDVKLRIEGVGKTFPAMGKGGSPTVALQDVSLDVDDGEFVSIVGPSGCGKSTLLDIIGGLQTPTTGRILVDGREVDGPGADRATVFQSYALFPWRTVVDNVAFPLEVEGVRKADRRERAVAALRLVGLHKFDEHYPAQLSGGMRQRVAIARAFVRDPEILLMDEPFGATDALTRELLQDHLSKLHLQERKTIVFITHSVAEAIRLSDRVVVLGIAPGRIVGSFRLPRSSERQASLAHRELEFSAVRDEVWELLKRHGIGSVEIPREEDM